jgi:putative Mn2+ efflux pump MntP
MEKLKERWGIDSNLALIAIFIVFAINGSFAAWVAKPITSFIGISSETTSAWIYWPLRILIVFPVYQITLPLVGWLFGQFKFFWDFEKKMLKRMGFKRFFNEENS